MKPIIKLINQTHNPAHIQSHNQAHVQAHNQDNDGDNNGIVTEFIATPTREFENMYNAIGHYYENQFERRKLLVYGFNDFPTELLQSNILKARNPSIAEIPHMHLWDSR